MRYSFQDRPVSKFGPPIWNCDKSLVARRARSAISDCLVYPATLPGYTGIHIMHKQCQYVGNQMSTIYDTQEEVIVQTVYWSGERNYPRNHIQYHV